MPRMTHPNLPGQPIDVHPDAVGARAKSGWVLEAPEAKPKPNKAASTPIPEDDTVDLGPDVAAGDADPDPASAGTHEE